MKPHLTLHYNLQKHQVVIFTKCVMHHEEDPYTITVTEQEVEKWQNGAIAQDAFPNLSVGDRERIISGICSKCFDLLWAEDSE